MPRFVLHAFLAILSFVAVLSAQSPAHPSGALRGTVKDSTGAVIPGATVTATDPGGRVSTTETGADGSYRINGLDNGRYAISVRYTGLQQSKAVLIEVKAGRISEADIPMTIPTQVREITVQEPGPRQVSTESANNASALVLRQEDLDALPDDPDDLQADLEALAGPSAGPGGTQIFIDGFTGGRLPPKSSIREIRINSNPFAAENDKLGFGRIDIFTKPGTDKFHGQGYFGTSEGLWNSRNPFLTQKPPFQTQLFGGNISGRLGKKGSFFVDVDRRNIDDNGILNATLPTANLLGTQVYQAYYPTPQRRSTVSPRVDYQLSSSNTLSLRYSFLKNDQTLTGIGSFNVPATTIGSINLASSGYSRDMSEQLVQVVDTAVISPSVINESHFQFARDYVSDRSVSTLPQVNVTNSFVAGGSGYSASGYGSTYDAQNQYELQNYTSLTSGAHTIKFGIRLRADDLKDYSPRNFNGTYTFQGSSGLSSIQQYLTTEQLFAAGYSSQQITAMGYGPSLYSVSSGNPLVKFQQLDVGAFLQDDWRVKPNLTLSFGLRWEAQTNINDKNDWAPRFSFAWSPDANGGRAKTVIRGGWGMFYDRLQVANVLNAYRYNGANQVNYVLTNPTVYNAAFSIMPPLSELQASNSTKYQIDTALKAPRLMQTVVSIERQLFSKTTLNANFIHSRGVHELITDDINAPLPGTYVYNSTTGSTSGGVRPYGAVGDIYDYQSTGIFKQTQFSVGVNSSTKWFTVFSRYSYGSAHSNTDGLSTMPSNPYDIAQDWGRSSLDIRHMLFFGSSINGPWGLRLSPFLIAHSGMPFNIITGTDIYGTGQIAASARPSVVSGSGENIVLTPYGYLNTVPQAGQSTVERNIGTGPGFLEFNLRLSKTWGFGTTKFEGISGGATARQGGGPPGGPGAGGPPAGGGPGAGGPPAGGGPGGGGPPGMSGESSAHRYNLTLSIMARNILNHANLSTPVGVITSPFFLTSTGITGGFGPESVSSNQRRIDIQLRFSF